LHYFELARSAYIHGDQIGYCPANKMKSLPGDSGVNKMQKFNTPASQYRYLPGQQVKVISGERQGDGCIKAGFMNPERYYVTLHSGGWVLTDVLPQNIQRLRRRYELSGWIIFLPGYVEDRYTRVDIANQIAAEGCSMTKQCLSYCKSFRENWQRETNNALKQWSVAAQFEATSKVQLRKNDVVVHYRAGDLLVKAYNNFRLLKFNWYVERIPKGPRRVLIVGQYHTDEVSSWNEEGNWKDTQISEELRRVCDSSPDLPEQMYAKGNENSQYQSEVKSLAVPVYVHFAKFILKARPDVQVVFASSGVNEDFFLMANAPVLIGSASRFSLAAATMRKESKLNATIMPYARNLGVDFSNWAGISWSEAPRAVQNPMYAANMTLGQVVHHLSERGMG
jgi:hypothetical protein